MNKYYYSISLEPIYPYIEPGSLTDRKGFLALQYFISTKPSEVFNAPEEGIYLEDSKGQKWFLIPNETPLSIKKLPIVPKHFLSSLITNNKTT